MLEQRLGDIYGIERAGKFTGQNEARLDAKFQRVVYFQKVLKFWVHLNNVLLKIWSYLVHSRNPRIRFLRKESCPHEVLNEVYLQFFLRMDVTFHDESNDSN